MNHSIEQAAENIAADVAAVGRIPVIPLILEIIARSAHMGFAAVARVTPERWVACAVHDDIKFGLLPGGELRVETTLCHEIRQSGQPVTIDHVSQDELYYNHR